MESNISLSDAEVILKSCSGQKISKTKFLGNLVLLTGKVQLVNRV